MKQPMRYATLRYRQTVVPTCRLSSAKTKLIRLSTNIGVCSCSAYAAVCLWHHMALIISVNNSADGDRSAPLSCCSSSSKHYLNAPNGKQACYIEKEAEHGIGLMVTQKNLPRWAKALKSQ